MPPVCVTDRLSQYHCWGAGPDDTGSLRPEPPNSAVVAVLDENSGQRLRVLSVCQCLCVCNGICMCVHGYGGKRSTLDVAPPGLLQELGSEVC